MTTVNKLKVDLLDDLLLLRRETGNKQILGTNRYFELNGMVIMLK